jgi:hypothetical protein
VISDGVDVGVNGGTELNWILETDDGQSVTCLRRSASTKEVSRGKGSQALRALVLFLIVHLPLLVPQSCPIVS